MNLRTVLALCAASALIGAVATKYFYPPITKVETVEHEVVRTDIHTVTRTVERPDGSRETTVDSTDHSRASQSRTQNAQVVAEKRWFLAATTQLQPQTGQIHYGAALNRRVVGPFYAGLSADTSGRVGLSLGFEF